MILNLHVGDHYHPAGYNRVLEIVRVSTEPSGPVYDAIDDHGGAWVVLDDTAVLTASTDCPKEKQL